MNLKQLSLLRESTSPFIDEGDGLTSERERVRMLLNLVAHASRYRMMVGTHNTVGCQMHVGGYVVWFQVWQMSVPAYIIDAQRHVRSFTMFSWYGKCRHPQHCRCLGACGGPYRMGVNGTHNTVGKMSTPTTLFVSGRLQSTVPVGVQGTVPSIVV